MLVPHRHSEDTTPIQRKVTHDYIVRIREAMEELHVPQHEPHSGRRLGRCD